MSQALSFKARAENVKLEDLSSLADRLRDSHEVEKLGDDAYEFQNREGDLAILQVCPTEVTLEGAIDDDLFEEFRGLASNNDAELLFEGELFEKDSGVDDSPVSFIAMISTVILGTFAVLFLIVSLLILPLRLLWAGILGRPRKG